ncbi:MAG: sulfatase [Candidatus Fermentibacteraceae bacterium]
MSSSKAVLILGAVFLLVSCNGPLSPARPNIIVIVIDSLRARNLSCYGYERKTTPAIDSLAATGTLWANCMAQSSWTLPSMTSIFTGLTERSHGAGKRDNLEYMLHPDAPFLANLMRDGQYRTYGHFNVAYLDDVHGFDRGFDSFRCEMGLPVRADAVTGAFMGWLDSTGTDEPFFAVLHLFDPHMPYNPPEPYNTMFGPLAADFQTKWSVTPDGVVLDPENRQHYIDLYDGETAFADNELSVLFAHLRSTGAAENTIILVTADHGEEFNEHGSLFHGHSFFQEVIHVPLIITGPGIPAGVVDSTWVGHFDVAPTILGLSGTPVPELMEGVDLFGAYQHQDRVIPSSGLIDPPETLLRPWECALMNAGVKTMRFLGGHGYTDFTTDISADPLEMSLSEVENSKKADDYLLQPRLWTPVQVETDITLNPVLRDLGYF